MSEAESFGRILKGTGDSVAATFYADGEPTDPGLVTVDIATSAGVPVATARATGGSGVAARTVPLTPVETAQLDTLTLTWHTVIGVVPTDFMTTAEVVGAVLFTVAAARSFDKGQLSSATLYPEAAIEEARGRIADAFAHICGVEFVPRLRRVTLDGGGDGAWHDAWRAGDEWRRYSWGTGGGRALELPDVEVTALRSVATRAAGGATWTEYTASELAGVVALPDGVLYRESGGWPPGRQNVRVAYECGFTQPPADIRRAALILAVNQLVPRDIGDRALSISSEVGTFRLSTAGERAWTWFGFPNVDAVLQQYARLRMPVIG